MSESNAYDGALAPAALPDNAPHYTGFGKLQRNTDGTQTLTLDAHDLVAIDVPISAFTRDNEPRYKTFNPSVFLPASRSAYGVVVPITDEVAPTIPLGESVLKWVQTATIAGYWEVWDIVAHDVVTVEQDAGEPYAAPCVNVIRVYPSAAIRLREDPRQFARIVDESKQAMAITRGAA